MGLDLYAIRWYEYPISFEEASMRVVDACGTVDAGLIDGMLDHSQSIRALVRACSNAGIELIADWDEPEISSARMKDIAARARFGENEIPFAALSARAFITTCAELNIGAYFG